MLWKKEDISFKMSDEMYDSLIKFIELKQKVSIKERDEETNKKLNEYRKNFIDEFRKNNVDAIKIYLWRT